MAKIPGSAPRKRYKTGRDALTKDEVEKLLGGRLTLEEETLLSLAIATGMRREDIVAIERSGVKVLDPDEGPILEITFWERKKRRHWKANVAGDTANRVLQYMESKPNKRWLFPGHHHGGKNHLASRTAYNVLQRVLKRAGLRSRPFHALRATCMKMAQRHGWSIEQVMELTGDSWRTVQEHYLTPSEDEMIEVAKKKAFP